MNARITADSAYDVSKVLQKIEFDEHWTLFREGKLPAQELRSSLRGYRRFCIVCNHPMG